MVSVLRLLTDGTTLSAKGHLHIALSLHNNSTDYLHLGGGEGGALEVHLTGKDDVDYPVIEQVVAPRSTRQGIALPPSGEVAFVVHAPAIGLCISRVQCSSFVRLQAQLIRKKTEGQSAEVVSASNILVLNVTHSARGDEI